MKLPHNLAKQERALSLAAGSVLTLLGLSRRTPASKALTGAGAALVAHGLAGRSLLKSKDDATSNDDSAHQVKRELTQNSTAADAPTSSQSVAWPEAPLAPFLKDSLPEHGGILVSKTVTVNAEAAQLYEFWRDFSRLPQMMKHLESVEILDEKRSKWTAKAPLNQTVSWEAEIVKDEPNSLIEWKSLPGATVVNSGSVRFVPNVGGRGTQVKVALEYEPPGGALGGLLAKLFGEEPNMQIDGDLRRFKSLIEAGEIPTVDGQPSGKK